MNEMTDYSVVNGRIANPGKFEGEPAWVPFFYALEDDDEFTDGAAVAYRAFQVNAEDRQRFPELKGVFAVVLAETDDGFVTGHTFATDYELGVFIAECELAADTGDDFD